jgi:hypothetical protein
VKYSVISELLPLVWNPTSPPLVYALEKDEDLLPSLAWTIFRTIW